MRTNMYEASCAECRRWVGKAGGYLYGNNNAVVCIECVYTYYGIGHGYLRPLQDNS